MTKKKLKKNDPGYPFIQYGRDMVIEQYRKARGDRDELQHFYQLDMISRGRKWKLTDGRNC